MSLGVTSWGNMTLACRCNSKTNSMFVSATHMIYFSNLSITDELCTYLWGKIGAHELGCHVKGQHDFSTQM